MASREAVREASRKRGRAISPELIEEILGSLGPSIIKKIIGVPNVFIGFGKNIKGADRFPVKSTLAEALGNMERIAGRMSKKANVNKPLESVKGGQRPPNSELEALAVAKQQAAKIKKADRATRKEGIKKRTKSFEDEFPKVPRTLRQNLIKGIKEDIIREGERAQGKILPGGHVAKINRLIRELRKLEDLEK